MNKIDFLSPIGIKNKTRIGRNLDGGYVVYNGTLAVTDRLLTYGVGWETSFEEDFNARTGKPVLMFDPTLFEAPAAYRRKYRRFLKSLQFREARKYRRETRFWKNYLGVLQARHIGYVEEGISPEKNGQYDTLEHHIERFRLKNETLLLKIDIEGGEYGLLDHPRFLACLGQVNQLVFEFHDLKNRLRDVEKILRLLGADFALVHVHGNNYGETFVAYDIAGNGAGDVMIPDVIEATLVRRSAIRQEDLVHETVSYPIPDLDYPNDPNRQDLPLDFA
ncbi:FkbM family methyltransferase [Chitinophaga sp.]|uniref:FkbM family methyltransferase n=1 Tax=Chitinophaga sp. TaxID=1869181 RepID=UPI002606CF84|nr:FkbM family methyltransferase [uncultured Chitinophaga sp.]